MKTKKPTTRQHYIPQLLLRGFAVPKGESHQVAVFKKDSRFIANTKNVAVGNCFYSAPEKESLDEKITDYEARTLSGYRQVLCSLPLGSRVEPGLATEFLAHLAIRPAFVREVFSDVGLAFLTKIVEQIKDDRMWRNLLGLDSGSPNDMLNKKINEVLCEHAFIEVLFNYLGVPKETVEKILIAVLGSVVKLFLPTMQCI